MRTRAVAVAGAGIALAALLGACGSASVSGADADIAFAQVMIPHHQQAVEMADLASARAASPEVKALAGQIKAAQDPEILMMQDWLEAWGAPMQMDDHGDSGHDMGGMTEAGMMTDEDMAALESAAGIDFDSMWLRMMIAHHEGAVAMARQVLESTADPDVEALAQAVIDGQEAEIQTMQGLLAGVSDPGDPSDPGTVMDAGEMRDHVHNIALDGPNLLLGTHDGLWRQTPGSEPTLVSQDAFDVMGLALAGERWLASGHPGEGMDAPADLGLLESTDAGATWQPVALSGEVDFHRLTASGQTVLGLSAHDGALLRSTDAGATWTSLGTPPLYDLAVNPSDPLSVVGTTEAGPVASSDAGTTFEPITGAPLIALLAWTDAGLYGVGVDGRVYVSTDSGRSWQARGTVGGQPSAVAADGTGVVALVGGTVLQSTDGGSTFAPRLTGVGGD